MKYAIVALLLFSQIACTTDTNSYTLSGSADGLEDGSKVIIYSLKDNRTNVIDTLLIKNGSFSGKFPKITEPSMYFMVVSNSSIPYFPESEDLKATIYNSVDRYGNVLEVKVEPSLPGMEQFTGSQNAINFPEEEVSIGSSWESESENQGMKIVTKYTVANINDGMISLDIAGDVSGIGTGTLYGKSTVEISSGVQTNATIEMNLSAQGIEMNLVTTSTMKKI